MKVTYRDFINNPYSNPAGCVQYTVIFCSGLKTTVGGNRQWFISMLWSVAGPHSVALNV